MSQPDEQSGATTMPNDVLAANMPRYRDPLIPPNSPVPQEVRL